MAKALDMDRIDDFSRKTFKNHEKTWKYVIFESGARAGRICLGDA